MVLVVVKQINRIVKLAGLVSLLSKQCFSNADLPIKGFATDRCRFCKEKLIKEICIKLVYFCL